MNGNHIHKNADENGPEVEGNLPSKYFEDLFTVKELKEWGERAVKNKYTDENFYHVVWNEKEYIVPLKAPDNVDEKLAERMYYYAKDKYFDLDCMCDHLRAENEIPEKIKDFEKGTEFRFIELFKDKEYGIIDEDEQFEIYFKILGKLAGEIKLKKQIDKEVCEKRDIDNLYKKEESPLYFTYMRI